MHAKRRAGLDACMRCACIMIIAYRYMLAKNCVGTILYYGIWSHEVLLSWHKINNMEDISQDNPFCMLFPSSEHVRQATEVVLGQKLYVSDVLTRIFLFSAANGNANGHVSWKV